MYFRRRAHQAAPALYWRYSAAVAIIWRRPAPRDCAFWPKGTTPSLAQLIHPVSNGSLVLYLDTYFLRCLRPRPEITKDETRRSRSFHELRCASKARKPCRGT